MPTWRRGRIVSGPTGISWSYAEVIRHTIGQSTDDHGRLYDTICRISLNVSSRQ